MDSTASFDINFPEDLISLYLRVVSYYRSDLSYIKQVEILRDLFVEVVRRKYKIIFCFHSDLFLLMSV